MFRKPRKVLIVIGSVLPISRASAVNLRWFLSFLPEIHVGMLAARFSLSIYLSIYLSFHPRAVPSSVGARCARCAR